MSHKASIPKSGRYKAVLFILAFAILGGILLLFATHAASPFTSVETEQGNIASPAVAINDTTASGRKAVQFGSSTTSSGWPDATNTGYVNGGADGKTLGAYTGGLTARGSYVHLSTAGQTLTHQSFLDGPTYIEAANVTCNGCLFRANMNTEDSESGIILVTASGFTCNFCTFEGTGPIVNDQVADPGNYGVAVDFYLEAAFSTISHSDISGMGDAVALHTNGHDLTLNDNFMHAPAYPGCPPQSQCQHQSITGMTDNDKPGHNYNITYHHNWMDAHQDNTEVIALQAGAPGFITYSNVQITDNYIAGCTSDALADFRSSGIWSNSTITGNVFSTLWYANVGGLGPILGDATPDFQKTGNLWHNNTWLVPAGSPGNPADNGKFLWPDASLKTTDFI